MARQCRKWADQRATVRRGNHNKPDLTPIHSIARKQLWITTRLLQGPARAPNSTNTAAILPVTSRLKSNGISFDYQRHWEDASRGLLESARLQITLIVEPLSSHIFRNHHPFTPDIRQADIGDTVKYEWSKVKQRS